MNESDVASGALERRALDGRTGPDADAVGGDALDDLLGDVPLELTVELGRVMLPLREVGQLLGAGSVVALSKLTGELLDVRVNDRLVARAEAVAVGDRYAARIVDIVKPAGGAR